MLDAAQERSVRNAFRAAGYDGDLRTLPLDSGEEICFILQIEDVLKFQDLVGLEVVVGEALGREAWVLSDVGNVTVPFGV